jgi:hypothetical protein
LGLAPATLEFWVRFPNERNQGKQAHPVLKYRVPHGSHLFLQAHRETEAHFTAAGMSSQTNNSEALGFKRAAFYNGLKSKVGLAAAKAAALRVNLNVQGCGIVAPPLHGALPLALPFCSPSFFHTISLLPAFTSA